MAFYFAEKDGDPLMTKIHMRDLSSRAKQWEHPVKGLIGYVESMKRMGGNILKLSKIERESYCISLTAMALAEDYKTDWWVNIPEQDPPDGLIMTLKQDIKGGHWAQMREIEVVEHRSEPDALFETLYSKMINKSYQSNTVLVCLLLTTSIYDLQELSERIAKITSPLKHVFIVFAGIAITNTNLNNEDIEHSYTMVQLLPIFVHGIIDSRPHLDDFFERFKNGQESRLIEGDAMFYGTSNKSLILNNQE